MKVDLSTKIVLVTGASRGIGRATAKLFAQKGSKVILHYHKNKDAAEKALRKLPGEGHIMIKADLSRLSGINKLSEKVMNAFGGVDILVNNAGIYDMLAFPEASLQEWEDHWIKTLGLNLLAPARLSFIMAKAMIKTGGGRIINISSRGAFRGEPEAMAYGASKAGLNALGQSMALALAPYQIFIYTIAPGFVDTDMSASALQGPLRDLFLQQSPLKRVATAKEIADTVLFCASRAPEFMTGCIIDVNGASYLRS